MSVVGGLGLSVYPRWRGEHHYQSDQICRYNGLSPLARGTLMADKGISLPNRFIPAGAGNTLKVYTCFIRCFRDMKILPIFPGC